MTVCFLIVSRTALFSTDILFLKDFTKWRTDHKHRTATRILGAWIEDLWAQQNYVQSFYLESTSVKKKKVSYTIKLKSL